MFVTTVQWITQINCERETTSFHIGNILLTKKTNITNNYYFAYGHYNYIICFPSHGQLYSRQALQFIIIISNQGYE